MEEGTYGGKKYSFCVNDICIQLVQGVALYPFLVSKVMRHLHQRIVCENVMTLVHEGSSKVAHSRSGSALSAIPGRIGIGKCWFLRSGENGSTQIKSSRSKGENQQQPQPMHAHNVVDTGI